MLCWLVFFFFKGFLGSFFHLSLTEDSVQMEGRGWRGRIYTKGPKARIETRTLAVKWQAL